MFWSHHSRIDVLIPDKELAMCNDRMRPRHCGQSSAVTIVKSINRAKGMSRWPYLNFIASPFIQQPALYK
jgi:hypothetical protein